MTVLQASQDCDVLGEAAYRCPFDGAEWTTRAIKCPENMDPAAFGRGDDCPKCGKECDQVVNWRPDDARAMPNGPERTRS